MGRPCKSRCTSSCTGESVPLSSPSPVPIQTTEPLPDKSLPPFHTNHCHPPTQITAWLRPDKSLPRAHTYHGSSAAPPAAPPSQTNHCHSQTNHCQPPSAPAAAAAQARRSRPSHQLDLRQITASRPYNSLPVSHINHCQSPIQITASLPYKSMPPGFSYRPLPTLPYKSLLHQPPIQITASRPPSRAYDVRAWSVNGQSVGSTLDQKTHVSYCVQSVCDPP